MQILHSTPPPRLAAALSRFEEQFHYPLGPARSFRICHGDDYPRFFRAIGEAACFVAEREGRVLGVLGAALRTVVLPNGAGRRAVYLGDLKIDESCRGGRVLPQLAEAARRWADGRADGAFAVVMDGTRVTPSRYTGRLGMPLLEELAKVHVLRIETAGFDAFVADAWQASAEQCDACYLRLSLGRHACPGGNTGERSAMAPLPVVAPDGRACARLEDTSRAKRLIADDGTEMSSAHLSSFAYRDARAAADLLKRCLAHAAARGMPALFLSVPAQDGEEILRYLGRARVVTAPATVYGTGLGTGHLWNINTAEI